MSWTVMFLMAVVVVLLNLARYVAIPVLTVLVYIVAIPGVLLLGIGFTIASVYDRIADWIEKMGRKRPNGFPNLPW